jgi:hypothetical protein
VTIDDKVLFDGIDRSSGGVRMTRSISPVTSRGGNLVTNSVTRPVVVGVSRGRAGTPSLRSRLQCTSALTGRGQVETPRWAVHARAAVEQGYCRRSANRPANSTLSG